VVIAPKAMKAGIPIASRAPPVHPRLPTRIEANHIQRSSRGSGRGIRQKEAGFRWYGILLTGLSFRLLLRFQTLA
jgi:hypothetical protein